MPGWNFIQAMASLPPISIFQRHNIPIPFAVEQCKEFIKTAYDIDAEPEMPFGKTEAIFRPSNASAGPVKFVFRISQSGTEAFRHNFYQLKGSLFIKSHHFFCFTIVDLPRAVSLHAMTKERLASEGEKKPYLSKLIWPQLAEALGNSMVVKRLPPRLSTLARYCLHNINCLRDLGMHNRKFPHSADELLVECRSDEKVGLATLDRRAQYSPYGREFYILEDLLGYVDDDGFFTYYDDFRETRAAFWDAHNKRYLLRGGTTTPNLAHVAMVGYAVGLLLEYGMSSDNTAVCLMKNQDRMSISRLYAFCEELMQFDPQYAKYTRSFFTRTTEKASSWFRKKRSGAKQKWKESKLRKMF